MAEVRDFLRGEIDLAERDRVRCQLALALRRPSDLLVDCRDLTFLDSSGIAVLVDVRQQLEAAGFNMLLVNVSGPPLRVLEMLGLTDWLSMERHGQPQRPGDEDRPADAGSPGSSRREITTAAMRFVDLRENEQTGNSVGV